MTASPNLYQLTASAGLPTRVNELMRAAGVAAIYGIKTIAALSVTFYGGRYNAVDVADAAVSMTASSTNYVVAHRSTGAITAATSTTNWNNSGTYARLWVITTNGTGVTDTLDARLDTGGVLNSASAGSPVGRHAVPIMAAAMQPSVTGGCGALASAASGSNLPDLVYLPFDATTQEYAQFSVPMPKSWNEGTVTFAPIWSHPSTATNFGVVWDLQAVALSNDDAIGTAFGTAQTSTDTGGTTDDLYIGPESSAITIAGTPAAEDVVFFRISRVTGNGSDTMAVDARLHGIVLYITTDAVNDA